MDFKNTYQQVGTGRTIFGAGAMKQLPNFIHKDQKVFIVTDKGVVQAGILKKVSNVLKDATIDYEIYDNVLPEAPIENVENAAGIFREKKCTVLLAVGGGSSIDTAKAIGLLVNNPGNLLEFAKGRQIEKAIPPLTAIPTTAGTGSEMTDAAIVADNKNEVKVVIRGGELMMAQYIFLDPNVLNGIPSHIAAQTGIDALTHALEALVSKISQPFSDGLSLQAIRLIFLNLKTLVHDPTDLDAAGNMLVASSLAGQSFNNAGLGLVHAMAHPFGAQYHVSHGQSCALYLPGVMAFNSTACAPKYKLAAIAMGNDVMKLEDQEAANTAVESVEKLYSDIGIVQTYKELGISFKLNEKMLQESLSMPACAINPRSIDHNGLKALYKSPSK